MIVTLAQAEVFLLILARMLGLFFEAPVFNYKIFPIAARIALATLITYVLWFVIPLPRILPNTLIAFGIALITEFAVGALIGFIARMMIVVIEVAGGLMDTQMGLSVGAAMDPQTGTQTTIVSTFYRNIATVIFLTVNGHHMLLSACHKSFKALPLGHPVYFQNAADQLTQLGVNLFSLGLQIAAPVILTIFLMDFAFGMISRVAPQVNVFMLGFQIKPIVGLFIFFAGIPLFVEKISLLLEGTLEEILKLFYNLALPPS